MPVDAENSSQTSASYFPQETLTDLYGKVKVLLHKGTVVKTSEVSGRRLIPPVTPLPNTTNRYPTLAAECFLTSVESLGLGDVDRSTNGKSVFARNASKTCQQRPKANLKKSNSVMKNMNNPRNRRFPLE